MTTQSKTFSAVGNGIDILVPAGERASYFVSGTFSATVKLQKSTNGGNTWETVASLTGAGSGTFDATENTMLRFACTAYVSGSAVTTVQNSDAITEIADSAQQVGAVTSVAGLTCDINFNKSTKTFRLDFNLASVAVTHTDAAASGSSGSLKLFDFVKGVVQILGVTQDLSFVTTAAITTSVGDMAFIHSLGSAACNAGDGALTGTEADIAAVSGTVTCSSDAATSKVIKGANTAVDGDTTAVDLYFNESGTAATSDANGTMYVSGTITVYGALI